jgi:hypothetical protein
MPTPFYHLSVAEELLEHPALPQSVRLALSEQLPAFLLGNTAPDVQVVSGLPREATHFFRVPILPGTRAPWIQMLASYPGLARAGDLPAAQAAFLAGYLCHLQADWQWILDIFAPVFGPTRRWSTFSQRLYLHNVLRSYLDRQIMPDLPAETAQLLKETKPERWLPFVDDAHLKEWGRYLAQQLEPGAAARTVEVFAARQRISPAEFYRLLDSESQMNAEIFSRLPRERLAQYRRKLVESNVILLKSYLSKSAKHIGAARINRDLIRLKAEDPQ